MKSSDIQTALSRIQDAVPGLVAVYLFGSQQQNLATAKSDVDLAILSGQALDPTTRYELEQDLEIQLGMDVDLIDLRAADTVMRAQVVSSGDCLLDIDSYKRELFEVMVYSAYALLNEERKGVLDAVRDRGSIYGR